MFIPPRLPTLDAAVKERVGVEDFVEMAGARDADAVAVAHDGSGVEDDEEHVVWIFAPANKRKDAVVGIVGVQPFETLPLEIDLMERRLGSQQSC